MVTMGLTHNFQGMMAARFFLGLAEAGLFPGINYYLSCWYKRDEFGIRAAIFFSAAAVSGSFGGLLAAAIGQMDGIGGKKGWAWIFSKSLPPSPFSFTLLNHSNKLTTPSLTQSSKVSQPSSSASPLSGWSSTSPTKRTSSPTSTDSA